MQATAALDRAYWSFGKGRSAERTVFQQSLRAESTQAKGHALAGLMWDGRKFYESFVLQEARDRALAARVPAPVVKLTFNFWMGTQAPAHRAPCPQ